MTVRFKCQSEYQKSYRVSRSRSVSPQRSAPSAGLRSDQMGISREPCLQRRKKLDRGGLAQSCSSLLSPQESQQTCQALKTAPPAACRSRSSHSRESALDLKSQMPPDAGAESGPAAEPETPAGPRPAADPEPSPEPEASEKSAQPRPSKHDGQPQPSRPPTAVANGPTPSNEHALRWRAGLRSGGQRSRGHQTEYNRQFSWKKPIAAASPLLTAEQMLYSSNRSVPPFKKNPVLVETEYQRSFQGVAPTSGPRLRKHLEQQRIPLFHTHMKHKKRRERSENKPHPSEGGSSPLKDETTPPPPSQVHRGHRIPEEGGATNGDTPQVTELRQKALSYRQRAWGANFSRDHLSQLLSEHNALWEPTDTTSDSATVPPSPRPASEPRPDPDSCSSSHVEALDLPSRSSSSSKRSSVVGSGENLNKNTQIKTQTPQSPAAGRRTAWGEEEEEDNTDEEEGRLPTPRLKLLPVQRTHHDLTTPATGGAILVGKVKGNDGSSPFKQRSASAVSMAAGAETAIGVPSKPKEAWSENSPSRHTSSGPSPEQKPAASPPSKPIKTKQMSPSPVAPPPLIPPPLHGIHGTLRHPDFQHNGELGARFRERPCSGGGCGSDEDDRLSVMSWRSAASCSMASAVLERAQKRRDNFWGKR
ncbi:nuclear protein MDM1 isoform X2 [Cheilinus undulatus]|uniref:nuclear protein MDM1 isoform X2 n=1 Tax=Cheilinus undulatus TaxID=241271 RepID=UPI001BD2B7E5|nr:nuclear protein MDM1 isoform X2 [Cheilinus undulatus]